MNVEYFKEFSPRLNRDMEFKVFGFAGKPVLVFPSFNGRFYQYEECGMVNACAPFINAGQITLFCADGIDAETFGGHGSPHDRIRRHEDYFMYVTQELTPRIAALSAKMNGGRKIKPMATGCSMGAYHAANVFFRQPDVFDSAICLSGLYRLNHFFGSYTDEFVLRNSPLDCLPALSDPAHLRHLRAARLVFCAGRGDHDERMLSDTLEMQRALDEKKIPAWTDIWGADVTHDWSWWRLQIAYFMKRVLDV